MRSIHGREIGLVFALLLMTSIVMGQVTRGNYNFQDFQAKPYYFGLTLGYNSSNFQILNDDRFIRNDSFAIAEARPGAGLNVSIVTNLKIGDHFDIRFLPGFSFSERIIAFKPVNGDRESTRNIESVFVQAPFQLRYRSAPYKDKRVFVVGGIKYTYDVASNSRVRKELARSLIKISPHDFAVEVGAGIQFFFPFFIFSPEIKFSQGLGNILIYNDELEQSLVIEKILSRAFTISLHFEG